MDKLAVKEEKRVPTKRNWMTRDGMKYTDTDYAVYWEDGEVNVKPHGLAWLHALSGGDHGIDYSAWTEAQREEARVFFKAKRDAQRKVRENDERIAKRKQDALDAMLSEIKSRIKQTDFDFIYEYAYEKGLEDGR